VERFLRRQYLSFFIVPTKNTCLVIAAVSSFKLPSPLKRQHPLQPAGQAKPPSCLSNVYRYLWLQPLENKMPLTMYLQIAGFLKG